MRAILLVLCSLAALAGGATDQQVYQDFLAWYKIYTGSFQPPEVAKAYTASLRAAGIPEDEAARRIDLIRKRMAQMPPEFVAVHFDRIYNMPNPPFKTEASQFLVRVTEGLKPGRALDVAMGQGRNALYLASHGWNVTGYDLSEAGMARAQALAAKSGVKIETVKATHDEFDYGTAKWDLIVETYAFTNLSDAGYRGRVIDSLKPGGMLVIEGFGGPKNVLLDGFAHLRVVAYEDRVEVADWGLQPMRLQRIAAAKE